MFFQVPGQTGFRGNEATIVAALYTMLLSDRALDSSDVLRFLHCAILSS
jgi:hypothetical protein